MSDTERKRERERERDIYGCPSENSNHTIKPNFQIWCYSDLDLDRWEIHSLLPN